MSSGLLIICLFLTLPIAGATVGAVSIEDLAAEPLHTFDSALVVGGFQKSGRSVLKIDPLEFAIITNSLLEPQAGAAAFAGGPAWRLLRAKDHQFEGDDLAGSYMWFNFDSATATEAVLDARGHSVVYVNGEPRGGDPYGHGFVKLPVHLRKGSNSFMFVCARGQLRAQLLPLPSQDPWIALADSTVPDLVVGSRVDEFIGIPVCNPSNSPIEVAIEAEAAAKPETAAVNSAAAAAAEMPAEATRSAIMTVPALSVLKIPVPILSGAPAVAGPCDWTLRLLSGERARQAAEASERSRSDDPYLDEVTVTLTAKEAHECRKETFVSAVDGSVQYYALVPPLSAAKATEVGAATPAPSPHLATPDLAKRPGLLLSLHGASVEATSQARCYAPQPDWIVVAPTNRRPFGFDWEDWGRLDALEAMNAASVRHHTDPRRQWLSGHSMGGHGTWQLGAHYPGRFAAIGPSAGWISFSSYSGTPEQDSSDPIQAVLRSAANPSRTLLLKQNFAQEGVFILHGDADDNVPVEQSRMMRHELSEFHSDFAYHEQRGAGHWWGDQCVDWPPMIDFLTTRTLPEPEGVDSIDFTTISPGINAVSHWVTVAQQQIPLEPSSVKLSRSTEGSSIKGTTMNVAMLGLDADIDGDAAIVKLEIDGQTISAPEPDGGDLLWLCRENGAWTICSAPSRGEKSPQLCGGFKAAFDRDVVLVVGTHGTTVENLWAANKARFDAEQFWIRGNGALEIVTDDEYLRQRGAQPALGNNADAISAPATDPFRDRNVVLYGHGDMNPVWGALIGDAPLAVRRGEVRLDDRVLTGDSIACVAVRPSRRHDDPNSLVGIVSGTGNAGLRLTERMPYFLSGTGYPDFLVIDADMLRSGASGFRAAGFFANDWTLKNSLSALSSQWITDPAEPQGP
ncbi:MAG: hypothetical protein EXS00_03665 [Phycisphaerales bacterium]|nr:hypothetical protein [Phycisphaerales bacterium]